MIVEGLLYLVYGLFALLTSPISIPRFDEAWYFVFFNILEYLNTGLQLLSCYVNLDFMLILFGVVVSVDVGVMLYKFVMWVLRKIPMLGIS